MGHKKDSNSKSNFLVIFPWMFKCYMQEKIAWTEVTITTILGLKKLYLLLPSSSDCKKKCKLVECHTEHDIFWLFLKRR